MENDKVTQTISQKLTIVLILTLFTIVMWGGLQIINAFTSEDSVSTGHEKYLEVLPSSYDTKVLDEVKERQDNYEEISESEFKGEGEESSTDTDTTE